MRRSRSPFQKRRSALVPATLKNQAIVAGFYGPESFAAYAKDGRDLYLEERWVLNERNWFDRPDESSIGLRVVGETVSLEFYK